MQELSEHVPSHFISLSHVSSVSHTIRWIAERAGLSLPEISPDALAEALRAADDDAPTLILDDLDALDDQDTLLQALAQSPRPLVWSARAQHPDTASFLRLHPLALEDARSLLAQWVAGVDVLDPALTELIETLDGLPLALHLLTSRLRALSPALLLRHLRRGDAQLGQGPLGRALSLSLEPLTALELQALRACTIFRGGFDLGAARAILAPEQVEVLGALVRASLLEQDSDGRYAMLWSVHNVLDVPLDAALGTRHAQYYSDLVHQGGVPEELLSLEEANLLSACSRGLDPVVHAECVLAYRKLRSVKGPYDELLLLVLDALDRFEEDARDECYVRLLARAGELYRDIGDAVASARCLERALACWGERREGPLFGGLNLALSFTYTRVHDYGRAIQAATRAQQHYAQIEDDQGWAKASQALAMAAMYERDLSLAESVLGELLERYPKESSLHTYMSVLYSLMGDAASARHHTQSAYDLCQEAGNLDGLFHACNNLVTFSLFDEDVTSARAFLERQEHVYRELGFTRESCWVAFNRANLLWHQGDLDAALQAFSRAQDIARERLDVELERMSHVRCLMLRALLFEAPQLEEALPPEGASLVRAAVCVARYAQAQTLQALEAAREGLSDPPQDIPSRLAWKRLRAQLDVVRVERQGARLRLEDEGRWMEFDGVRHDMRRRTVSRRLLWALATQALRAPGVELGADELYQEGWPDEVRPVNARQRLHTAIYRLRGDLLGDLLETRDEGYLLSPSLTIELDPGS